MKQTSNVHERQLPASADKVGALIDTLASSNDLLWPSARWPAMRLSPRLTENSVGGHGPIRYRVIEYRPRQRVRFAFLEPPGLTGEHAFEVFTLGKNQALLRHWLVSEISGSMRWWWPLIIRPLHDALIEDALDHALAVIQSRPYQPRQLSPTVKLLRRVPAMSVKLDLVSAPRY